MNGINSFVGVNHLSGGIHITEAVWAVFNLALLLAIPAAIIVYLSKLLKSVRRIELLLQEIGNKDNHSR